ncbi:hypothetical protein FD754_009915 [Muntiacus muntjak]|uniref:Uncharacterized protein n=1 Tax=Muntiacus muntjak TaxID=9888 RepID=A0A5N3WV15_MUNMU|nr:hypothetical protein FD754_009915 [Muntiacus muntjak]
MTKKRKRQDDFQKVKLKVGKKKPRSENATLTNFKTKTIHLPEQLKEDVTLPTNNRKLNIKDLLSQMHHYNAGVKQSALLGLRDLLSQYPYMLDAHLSHILSEVAAVFTDKDAAVRSAAVQLLRSLAPHIRAEQISPLFPLVSAHLSSAMTHIAEGVQEDALRVLDVLLEQYPALLTDRSSILLKNFVELISHQRPSRGLVNRHRSQSWILSVNPNRRLTSQQWRLKVLVRLSKFLQALTDGSSRLRESEGLQEQKENPHATSNSIFINWKEHASDQQHIQVYENGGSQPNVSSQFRLRYLVGGLGTVDEGLSSTENLKGFIEIIIPLLIECWIEAVPPQLAASVGNGIEREPLQVMQQVLNIISLLWKLSKQHDETHKLVLDFSFYYLCQEMDETEDLMSNPEFLNYYVSGNKLYVNLLGVCFFVFFLIKDINWKTFLKVNLYCRWLQYRSKVLSRWLAGLPLQLAHLGSRNPELSTQLIDIIHTAAARANKELLKSLQVTALRIYGKSFVYLSSFSGWKSSVKEWNGSVQLNISNEDYFSFLFSTLTGFSKEELTWLQSLRGVPHVIQTQLSPVLLYLTDLDQFSHHWDVTETVCHSFLVVPVRSQSFDVLQTAISKHLVGLTVIPDSTAGCVLGVVCKLLDHTCVLSEALLPFLASCCYSLLYFLLTLEKGEAEHLRKRDRLWGVCVSVLALLPRVLRLMLQSLRVSRAGPEELPVVGQLLRLLLQHAPLRTHMLTNAILVQQIIKNITTLRSGGAQEPWLTDLHYCFNVHITGHPRGPSALSAVY